MKSKSGKITDDEISYILSKIENGCRLQDVFEMVDNINPDVDTGHFIKYLYQNKMDDYLYEIKNISNNMIYVGSTNSPVRRTLEHIFKSSSKELRKDIGKYGRVSFTVRCWKENKDQEYIHMNKYDKKILYNKRLK